MSAMRSINILRMAVLVTAPHIMDVALKPVPVQCLKLTGANGAGAGASTKAVPPPARERLVDRVFRDKWLESYVTNPKNRNADEAIIRKYYNARFINAKNEDIMPIPGVIYATNQTVMLKIAEYLGLLNTVAQYLDRLTVSRPEQPVVTEESTVPDVCAICLEAAGTRDDSSGVVATICCKKQFCKACLTKWVDVETKSNCPLCRNPDPLGRGAGAGARPVALGPANSPLP